MVFVIAAPTDHRTLYSRVHVLELFLERSPMLTPCKGLAGPSLRFSRRCLGEFGIYSGRGIADGTRSCSCTGEPTKRNAQYNFSISGLVSYFSLKEALRITMTDKFEP